MDDTTPSILAKKKKNVRVTIYTKNLTKQLKLDTKKHNEQYPPITLQEFMDAHDRSLIIDDKTIYHIGASLKDLGKKWFIQNKVMNVPKIRVFLRTHSQRWIRTLWK